MPRRWRQASRRRRTRFPSPARIRPPFSSPPPRVTRIITTSAAIPRRSTKELIGAACQIEFRRLAPAPRRRPSSACSAASSLDLGDSAAAEPADRRAHQELSRRQRSGAGGALFPIWPLPAHFQFASRRPARQFAGPLEREHEAALGQQIHHQHQHRDELLARRNLQPRRMRRTAHRPWCSI